MAMKRYFTFPKVPDKWGCLVSYLRHSLGDSYPSAEMRSVYSIVWCGMLPREGKGGRFPDSLCLNQQTDRSREILTKVNSLHSMTCIMVNKEKNPGHLSIVTGWNGGRRKKSNDWPIDPLASKWHFFVREIWKRIFSLWTEVGR